MDDMVNAGDVPQHIPVASRDEIGQMLNGFNRMFKFPGIHFCELAFFKM